MTKVEGEEAVGAEVSAAEPWFETTAQKAVAPVNKAVAVLRKTVTRFIVWFQHITSMALFASAVISRATASVCALGLCLSIGGLFVAELVDIVGKEGRREACAAHSMPSSLQIRKLRVRRR